MQKTTDKHIAEIERLVGDTGRFGAKLCALIEKAERKTAGNTGVTLTIAANYGGRWDILQAFNRFAQDNPARENVSEENLAPYLAMSYAPEPDLFIRTG